MLIAIRIFQLINISSMICSILHRYTKRQDSWRYLRIASWVFYLCGIMSFVLSFGIAAMVEDNDKSQYGICLLFLVSCITCALLMITQKLWCVKYNDEVLYFRNSFGLAKKYDINKLVLIEGERMNKILFNGMIIIKWDNLIVDLQQDVEISRFFQQKNN